MWVLCCDSFAEVLTFLQGWRVCATWVMSIVMWKAMDWMSHGEVLLRLAGCLTVTNWLLLALRLLRKEYDHLYYSIPVLYPQFRFFRPRRYVQSIHLEPLWCLNSFIWLFSYRSRAFKASAKHRLLTYISGRHTWCLQETLEERECSMLDSEMSGFRPVEGRLVSILEW